MMQKSRKLSCTRLFYLFFCMCVHGSGKFGIYKYNLVVVGVRRTAVSEAGGV